MSSKQKEFSSLLELMEALPDEQSAVDHFTAIRWKNGEFCPYCGCDRLYHFGDNRTHKCAECRQRFSIKVGTIFEDSKLGLRTWMLAVWYCSSHKKSISSVQLAKDLGITQKSAWFVMHRLRHAARTRSFNRPLTGEVEADEAFFGGREKNKHKYLRGLKRKAIVFGALERGGELRAHQVETLMDIPSEVRDNVKPGAALFTDEWRGYRQVGKNFQHETVKHSKDEYARGRVHVNSLEGYWSQLKRQVYGTHHWVSYKHLDRYVAESVWKYNRRDVADAPRFNELLAISDGRLRYSELIA